MEYFIQVKGKETGPVDQGTLVDWCRKGQIKEDTLVKNNLMTSWKPAKGLTILKPIFAEQAAAKGQSLGSRLSDNMNSHRKGQGINNNTVTLNSVKTASLRYRLGAGIIDAVVIYIIYIAISFPYQYLVLGTDPLAFDPATMTEEQIISLAETLPSLFLISIFVDQIYRVLCVGGMAQTLGQKFFGIMQIKHNTLGEPVLMGRSYFFNTFFILFFPINLLFIFIFRRGLHEMLSGVSVVNVRLG